MPADNPDQRIAADAAALCDCLSAVVRVAAAAPFKLLYYRWAGCPGDGQAGEMDRHSSNRHGRQCAHPDGSQIQMLDSLPPLP